MRHVDFLVTVGRLGIEQEIDQRTFQTRALTAIDDKTRTGGADAIVPANQAVFERELDVILRLHQVRLAAPLADNRIGRFIAADRASLVGEIRNIQQQLRLAGRIEFGLGVEFGDLIVDAADFCFDRGSVLALALEHADLFGNRFARVLQLLLGSLRGAACLVTGEHVVDEFPMVSAPGFKAFLDG